MSFNARTLLALTLAVAHAAPAPQAASSASSVVDTPMSEIPGASLPIPPVVKTDWTIISSHGPYTGPAATVTGANTNEPVATMAPASPLPPNPTALVYNPNGTLNEPMALPYQPAGGLGTNGTEPIYRVQSDFDYQSILVGLYQEWIELDLFNYIYATYSEEDFADAGLTAADRNLVEFMATQEIGHATLLSNMLGGPGGATPQCTYNYPFKTLREAFDFCQKLTRFGESGVLGFIQHLNAREVAQLLHQSISTESRQQMIFRQFLGLQPMEGLWFEAGIPQSWAWTLLAPYIAECPADSKRLSWQNFPQLTILSQPNNGRRDATQTALNETTGFGPIAPSSQVSDEDSCVGNDEEGFNCTPAISQDRYIPLSYPGKRVDLQWEDPGMAVGPNNSYVTSTSASTPKFVLWVSQLNATYSPLLNVSRQGSVNTGYTIQPNASTFAGDPAVNGTAFIALTDADLPYTPFNLSLVNPHVVALNIYQAG